MFSVPKFAGPVCVFSAPGELHCFVATIMLHFRHMGGVIDHVVATEPHHLRDNLHYIFKLESTTQ